MRPRFDHRHQNHMDSKDVKQGQWAHDAIVVIKEQLIAKISVVNHPFIAMRHHFRHARGAACVEIGAHAIACTIVKAKAARVAGHFGCEIMIGDTVHFGHFRPDQGNNHRFGEGQIAVQIHF